MSINAISRPISFTTQKAQQPARIQRTEISSLGNSKHLSFGDLRIVDDNYDSSNDKSNNDTSNAPKKNNLIPEGLLAAMAGGIVAGLMLFLNQSTNALDRVETGKKVATVIIDSLPPDAKKSLNLSSKDATGDGHDDVSFDTPDGKTIIIDSFNQKLITKTPKTNVTFDTTIETFEEASQRLNGKK